MRLPQAHFLPHAANTLPSLSAISANQTLSESAHRPIKTALRMARSDPRVLPARQSRFAISSPRSACACAAAFASSSISDALVFSEIAGCSHFSLADLGRRDYNEACRAAANISERLDQPRGSRYP